MKKLAVQDSQEGLCEEKRIIMNGTCRNFRDKISTQELRSCCVVEMPEESKETKTEERQVPFEAQTRSLEQQWKPKNLVP